MDSEPIPGAHGDDVGDLDLGRWVRANRGALLAALVQADRQDLAAELAAALGTTLAEWGEYARAESARRAGTRGPGAA